VLIGELETDVVLGQQDVRDAPVDLGLVLGQPQQLGRGEPGQRSVAGQLHEPIEADALLDLLTLRLRAPVVPQDRGAQRTASRVERDEPVHLAREPDAGGVGGVELLEDLRRPAPPVLGILLAPAGTRRR